MARSPLTKVLADDLENDQAASLVAFMRTASNGNLTLRGKKIEITGLTSKKVKFLLRKFLHTNHLNDFDVLNLPGNFEIVRIGPDAKKEKRPKRSEPLKHPVPYGPPIPYLSGVVKPILQVEWQGQPPPKKNTRQEVTPEARNATDPQYIAARNYRI
jgi:hypothetical protein